MDTGIALHPDLNVVGGVNCTTEPDWQDKNGHGTHVAGIIGALNNDIGVVGLAPGARLWAVKVLDATGNGNPTTIGCGLDWILAHKDVIDVVNYSLTFGECPAPYDSWAVERLPDCEARLAALVEKVEEINRAGIIQVFATGNDGYERRYSWLAVPGVIGVGALADFDGQPGGGGLRPVDPCAGPWGLFGHLPPAGDDQLASFTNTYQLDLLAPGVCVLSTLPGGYGVASGTSMAAPHVAGIAARLKAAGLAPYSWQAEIALRLGSHERIEDIPVADCPGALAYRYPDGRA